MISAKVFEDIDRCLDLTFKDIGSKSLKNIEKPVHAYQLETDDESPDRQVHPDLPEKPSIAVLPFDNLSDDPAQDYFGLGIAEAMLNLLSRIPELLRELGALTVIAVIARSLLYIFRH